MVSRKSNKKLTHEFVEAEFAREGYELRSQYVNASTNLNLTCPAGHSIQKTWADFQSGGRCAYCKKVRVNKDYVKQAFSNAGYLLLSEYKTAKGKLEFICPNKHQYRTTWDQFRQGARCAVCAGLIVTHEQVKAKFESEGYKLLGRYVRSGEKLEFICPNRHQHSMTWTSFRAGKRCLYCAGLVVTHEYVEKFFAREGYTLLNRYVNNRHKLEFVCPNGHRHSIAWSSFRAGNRCGKCVPKVTHDQVFQFFELEGYKLLSKYVNSERKLEFICPNGHQHSMDWSNFKAGHRCGKCFGLYPSERDRQLKELTIKIRSRIVQAFNKCKKGVPPKSKTNLANRLAIALYEHLGHPPDGYQVDHIVPCSFFDMSDEHQIEACWSLHNCRYLSASKNYSRSNRLPLNEVEQFSFHQLLILKIASNKPKKWVKYIEQWEAKNGSLEKKTARIQKDSVTRQMSINFLAFHSA